MNTTFTIQFDCTDRLERALSAIAMSLQGIKPNETPTPHKVEEEPTKPEPKPEPKVEAKEKSKPDPKVETKEKSKPEPKVETKEESKSVETITDQDLRAAMKDCRERNLASNPDDAILRKAINDNLRSKVSEFGCKSSMELSQEQRVMFVEYCSNLTLASSDEPF